MTETRLERAIRLSKDAEVDALYSADEGKWVLLIRQIKESPEWAANRLKVEHADRNRFRRMLEVAVGALRTGVGHEPLNGLEPRRFSEALAEIERLAAEGE